MHKNQPPVLPFSRLLSGPEKGWDEVNKHLTPNSKQINKSIMKEFLLLFRGGEGHTAQESPEKWQAHMQKWMQWMGKLKEDGKLIGAQPLTKEGKTIRGSEKVITDGPFMEGKEMVGGYLACKADNYDEAVEIAKGCPILEFETGVVEVREIQELKM